MESNILSCLPPRPHSIDESGLDRGSIMNLAIKILYTGGVLRGQEVANALKLPNVIVSQALESLSNEYLIEVKGATEFGEMAYQYAVSRAGRLRAQDLMERNRYVGPAPVTLDAYTKMVSAQSVAGQTIAPDALRRALAHLVLGDDLINQLGPAINSGRSVFIYGNSGDGKTSIGLALEKLLSGAIWVPYAIDVQGQIIKVFDPLRHRSILTSQEDLPSPVRKGLLSRLSRSKTDGDEPVEFSPSEPYDERWVPIRRPLIVAGGELTLNYLDLVYDATSRYYEAPQQMKANGGVFLLDDLGRQQTSPREILNRWIVPLEKHVDYLNLAIGYKFEVPFDVLVIFATNLKPEDLVDEAFLRRIRYKVHVPDPTWDEFSEILRREAAKRLVPYSEPGMQYLIETHYIQPDRQPRGVHPRDLLDQLVDIARFQGVAPTLSKELLDQACQSYFLNKAQD